MFNVINSSKMNSLRTVQEFSMTPERFTDNKMVFKDQGHNKFWQKIQGQFLALKDVWQP